jgi:hypothetical protein
LIPVEDDGGNDEGFRVERMLDGGGQTRVYLRDRRGNVTESENLQDAKSEYRDVLESEVANAMDHGNETLSDREFIAPEGDDRHSGDTDADQDDETEPQHRRSSRGSRINTTLKRRRTTRRAPTDGTLPKASGGGRTRASAEIQSDGDEDDGDTGGADSPPARAARRRVRVRVPDPHPDPHPDPDLDQTQGADQGNADRRRRGRLVRPVGAAAESPPPTTNDATQIDNCALSASAAVEGAAILESSAPAALPLQANPNEPAVAGTDGQTDVPVDQAKAHASAAADAIVADTAAMVADHDMRIAVASRGHKRLRRARSPNSADDGAVVASIDCKSRPEAEKIVAPPAAHSSRADENGPDAESIAASAAANAFGAAQPRKRRRILEEDAANTDPDSSHAASDSAANVADQVQDTSAQPSVAATDMVNPMPSTENPLPASMSIDDSSKS